MMQTKGNTLVLHVGGWTWGRRRHLVKVLLSRILKRGGQVLPRDVLPAEKEEEDSCGVTVPANLAAAMRSILPVIDVNVITVDVCRQLQPLWYQCTISYENIILPTGYAVAQLVEALRYKRKSRGFDSQWSH